MTQPGSVIPPQPGWWVRSGRAGTVSPTYGWENVSVGNVPLVYGAKRSILLPNPGNHMYPILTTMRQAMAGGKILTRPRVDEYGDPGIGARTKIYIPNPGGRTYPLLRPFRLGSPILIRSTGATPVFDSVGTMSGAINAASGSWTQTIAASTTLIVDVIQDRGGAPTSVIYDPTGANIALSQIGSVILGSANGASAQHTRWAAQNIPGGSGKTISVPSFVGGSTPWLIGASISYRGVNLIGTTTTVGPTTISPITQVVPAPSAGTIAIQGFGVAANTGGAASASSYTGGTVRNPLVGSLTWTCFAETALGATFSAVIASGYASSMSTVLSS